MANGNGAETKRKLAKGGAAVLEAERKQAEEALRESEYYLREAQHIAHIGSWDWQIKPNSLHWSDEMYHIFGIEQTQFGATHEAFINCVHPEDREFVKESISKAMSENKPHDIEYRIVLPNGRERIIHAQGRVIFDNTGEPIRVIGTVHDITERRQAERELRESEERFRSIVENSQVGILILDDAYHILYVNDETCRVAGYSRDEAIGQDFRKFIAKESQQLVAGRYVQRQRGEKVPSRYEFNFVGKDGQKKRVETSAAVIRDSAGKTRTMVQILDITERKQVEEELKESEARYKALTMGVPVGIYISDFSGTFLYGNEQAAEIVGYKVEELVGKNFRKLKLLDAKGIAKALKLLALSRLGKATGPDELVLNRKDGTKSLVEINTRIITVGGKKVILGMVEDITERKQAEEELQAEKNKLQSIIGAMEDGLTIQDKDYNIIYQNELLKELFGDRLGEKCYRVYEGQEELCDGCPVKKAFRDGKSHTSERKVVMPSGEVNFWENTANPIRDANGNIVSCLEVTRNITERKQAEEGLHESEARYRAVIEGAHDMIQSVDCDGHIIFVNKAWLDTLGYTKAELPSLNMFNIIHPDSREHCEKLFAQVMKGKSVEDMEAVFLTKDGRKVLVEGNAAPRYMGDEVVATQGIFRDVTERKQAEEKLRDEATRHRVLIDESRDGIVILDEQGKVYEANKRFAEMLGYTPQEVRKLSVWDWEFQFPREQVAEMLRTVDETGDHFETRHRRKDGTVYDVEISTNGAVYAGQKLIFCVCRDITERKKAEQALAEAEKKYKTLVEATSDLIWEADTQGNYTFVSPNIKDLLGYEVEEVVGKKRTLDFTPKKELKKWLKRFKEVNAKKVPFSGFEVPHRHKNGKPLIFEVSGTPFFDNEGNFKGYVGINKDITEREQMTEALKESQKFSTGIMENSPNPKIVLNPDTSIRYANPAFEKLTGYKLAQIVGRRAPYPWWSKEESRAMTLSLKKAILSGGKRSEKVFHRKNGEPFWVAINSAPIIYRKKLRYFLISWLDISDRKRAEEERAELERKAHLASRLASVGEMASGIAHEINNPLTAVIGFSQLLMDTELPEEIREDLDIIHKEAQRAASVARNLLTFARKHAPSKQLTSVNSLIEGVLTLRAYEQNVSNIKINTKLAPDLPEVMADYSQLQQVFINIILNAEAAMLEANNGGTLTITTQRFNQSVRASFADDGPGIDKENLNRIFDPFFTTKEVGKGTGLGLSVCHGIIAEHGGRIYAKSKPGSGATFIVELPIDFHEQLGEPNEPAKKPEKKNTGS